MSGKIAKNPPKKPTIANDTPPAVHAMRRARAIRPAPIDMPIIGTDAMPTANGQRRQHELKPSADAVTRQHLGAEIRSRWVKIVTVSTTCNGEKQATAPTFRMSLNMAR